LPGVPLRTIATGDSLTVLGRPAAFAGKIPCGADCHGIDVVLILHPDGSYRVKDRVRGGSRPSDPMVEVGRWSLRSDSVRRLTLHGGRDPERQFEVSSELRLRFLDPKRRPADTTNAHALVRISAPGALDATFLARGHFRDFADAPLFVECVGGSQFPVGGDSAFVRLQDAQRRHALGAGAGIVVDVGGRLEDRAGAEEGTRAETVVVDTFEVAEPTARCAAARVRALIAVGDWELTALDGALLPELDRAVRPTLRFLLSDATISGNAGCNRLTGHAVLRGLDLVPRPVALTKRMCADSTVMARENRYAQILADGGWFRIDAGDLVLSHGGLERSRFRRR
jgi:heat shock protein HslJ